MKNIREIINKDFSYDGYVVYFNCITKQSDNAIDKLLHYFKNTPRCLDTSLYILTFKKNGNLFAFFENIRNVNNCKDYEKMIINVLNSKVRLCRNDYDLTVLNTEKYDNLHYWLYDCINKNDMWKFIPYIDRTKKHDEPDIEELFCNLNYIGKFINSDYYKIIGKDYEYKNRMNQIQKKTKERKRQIGEELFIRKLKKHFRFIEQGYLSKKVVCDLLNLDYTSKKDIKDLNKILTDYGVSYDKLKMIKGNRGVFLGISLK
tara:strand:+ start:8 stop:787 length:780 start_codon:yes stop_codon:yes gene_type:complete